MLTYVCNRYGEEILRLDWNTHVVGQYGAGRSGRLLTSDVQRCISPLRWRFMLILGLSSDNTTNGNDSLYRQSQSGVTIVGLGWFSPTDRKTFAVYRVFDTEGAVFSKFSQRIRG